MRLLKIQNDHPWYSKTIGINIRAMVVMTLSVYGEDDEVYIVRLKFGSKDEMMTRGYIIPKQDTTNRAIYNPIIPNAQPYLCRLIK